MTALLYIGLMLPFYLQTLAPQTQAPAVYFKQAFNLPQHGEITLTDSTSGETGRVILSLGYIVDSRCPKDVMCIQAGNAEVNITLTVASGESATIRLGVGGNKVVKPLPARADSVVLAGCAYTITVLDVAPYPIASEMQLYKNARIIVARL